MTERVGNAVAEHGTEFMASDRLPDVSKPCSTQNCRRTAARASVKVGRGLRYQASVRTAEHALRLRCAASKATIENSASRQGVVRVIARSDYCCSPDLSMVVVDELGWLGFTRP
jgi:hypothetical protein